MEHILKGVREYRSLWTFWYILNQFGNTMWHVKITSAFFYLYWIKMLLSETRMSWKYLRDIFGTGIIFWEARKLKSQ